MTQVRHRDDVEEMRRRVTEEAMGFPRMRQSSGKLS